MDFSRVFDTIRHQPFMQKMGALYSPENIFNRLVLCHITKLHNVVSLAAFINGRIIQGSAVGPPAYMVAASDRHPIHADNHMLKYADKTYLLVGSSNIATLAAEFERVKP